MQYHVIIVTLDSGIRYLYLNDHFIIQDGCGHAVFEGAAQNLADVFQVPVKRVTAGTNGGDILSDFMDGVVAALSAK